MENIFILKLLLTPTLIGLISLAGRRWGPSISGLLVGIPLTSAPVAFFIALNEGVSFASATAMGILAGTISQAAFCIAYRKLAHKVNWLISLVLSSLVFIASTGILQFLNLPLTPLYLLVILFLMLGLRLTLRKKDILAATSKPLPKWDMPARMIVATTYVVSLTGIAPYIGPHLTGLLSPFPLYAAILAVFAHRLHGPSPADKVIHGLMVGLFGFASFFLVLSGLLPQVGITTAFIAATITVLAVQAVALQILKKIT